MVSKPLAVIDFKKIGTPGYRSYRVLQSPGLWAQVYRNRIAAFGDYRSAVIFPEQLLGLKQTLIYVASCSDSTNSCGVTVAAIREWSLMNTHRQTRLETAEDILEFESTYHNSLSETEYLGFGGTNGYSKTLHRFTSNAALFTGKHDAYKFVNKFMDKKIRNLS